MFSRQWEVVGGADIGGILVREGKDTTSPHYCDRLATGALVEERELEGDRLHYEKLCGKGPHVGWISIKMRDEKLAMPVQSRKRLEQIVKIPFHYNSEIDLCGCVSGCQPGAPRAPVAVVLFPGSPDVDFGASHGAAPLMVAIEKAFSEKGIVTLRFDYVGVGMSAPGGSTLETRLWKPPTHKEAGQSALCATQWAKEHLSDNIIACGYSMGSSHALEVTKQGLASAYVSLSIGHDIWKFLLDPETQDELKKSMQGQSSLSCPVLYVVGDKDRLSPLGQLMGLIKARKDSGLACTLNVIKDGVHDLRDRETEVAQIVTRWVSGLETDAMAESMGA